MKKKNNNDEETWLAIKMGLMMAYSRTQACYREQVLDRLNIPPERNRLSGHMETANPGMETAAPVVD